MSSLCIPLPSSIILIKEIPPSSISMRMGRKKDKKAFEENAHKQQQVIRKHEAEINVLKDKAEQGQEALQKVDQLEQIVNNLTEGGASE